MYICGMKRRVLLYLCLLLLSVNVFGASVYKWKELDAFSDSLNRVLETVNYKDNNRMVYYPLVMQLYERADATGNSQIKARAFYWDAWLNFETDIEKTEELIDSAYLCCDSLNYVYDFARIAFANALILSRHNSYKDAYRSFKTLESIFVSINDVRRLGYTYVNLGSILKRVGQYNEAMQYYLLADEIFANGNLADDRVKNRHNIGVVYHHLDNTPEAIATLSALLNEPVAYSDPVFRVEVLTSLYYVSQNLADKEYYAREAYRAGLNVHNKTSQTYTLINMGALFIYKHNNDSALYYFQQAHDCASDNKDAYSLIHALYGLSEIYDRKQQPDSAYRKLEQYLKFRESTTGSTKSIEINRLEASNAIKQYEKELIEVNDEV